MRTPNILYYRYFLFVLLILSNAIICSAAVWNLSLAREAGFTPKVDVYMIFLGAFSLLVIFPIVFINVSWKHALIGRVWAECVWVGLLAVLHIAGAAAFTAIIPSKMCSPNGSIHVLLVDGSVGQSCTSTKFLMAFAWTCTASLAIYFVVLVASAYVHQRIDDTVWHASVGTYPWYLPFECRLRSRPGSPVSPNGKHHSLLPAPQPRRPVVLPIHTELVSNYQVEHLSPPEFSPLDLSPHGNSGRPVPPVPAAPYPQHVVRETRQVSSSMPSFYPLHIQAAWSEQGPSPPEPALSPTSPARREPTQLTPPPLGEWPRADILKQPSSKSKSRPARKAPPAAFTSLAAATAAADPEPSPALLSAVSTSPGRSRPTGPRKPSSEMHRPTPLDLSRIPSTHR